MIKRIKKVLEREKNKSPNSPTVYLLARRTLQVIKNKYFNARMHFTKDGTFKSEDDIWMCSLFPQKILDLIIVELKPKSVLDVGCGTGVSLQYLIQNNILATGIENSEIAITKSPVKENIIRHNLNAELKLDRHFDLVWCFEVIEHIHPDYESNFLATITNHSSTIILSAARPGQGGHGHFNEQEPEYWINRFLNLGYYFDKSFTDKLKHTKDMHAENILCFRKNPG